MYEQYIRFLLSYVKDRAMLVRKFPSADMGVSENRGPEYSTPNSILIIRIPKYGTPNFRKLPNRSSDSLTGQAFEPEPPQASTLRLPALSCGLQADKVARGLDFRV